MVVSSRSPEGVPNRCPVCQADVCIEPSFPCGDAPCPNCGQLLWFAQTPAALYVCESRSISEVARVLIRELCHRLSAGSADEPDSLDVVELVMELEDEFTVLIPDEAYARIKTVEDFVRYLMRGGLNEGPAEDLTA